MKQYGMNCTASLQLKRNKNIYLRFIFIFFISRVSVKEITERSTLNTAHGEAVELVHYAIRCQFSVKCVRDRLVLYIGLLVY